MSAPKTHTRTTSRPAVTSPIVAMWSLFLGVLLMMMGNGLQGTLLGVRSSLESFDTVVIGIISAAYYAGFLIGSRFTMRALGRVGHVRVFAALASLASTASLLHAVFVNPPSWFAMRLLTGFCMAGLYVVAESWLNDQAVPEKRGQTLSIYMVVTMGGVTGGQFLLNVADPGGFELFVIASVLVSMSLVPMALSEASAPRFEAAAALPLRTLVKVVPTGVIVMFLSGFSAAILFAIGPVYGASIGMSTAQISIFVSAAVIGATLLQMPIGYLSDKVPRRGIMVACAVVATVASVGGIATSTGVPGAAAMFAIGATSFPLYSLAIAYTNDWIDDDQRVGASALLVMINGVGAVLGPLAASIAMRLSSPSAYFAILVFSHGVLVVYLLSRIVFRDAIPIDEQTAYRPVPARSSVLAAIGRRRPRK